MPVVAELATGSGAPPVGERTLERAIGAPRLLPLVGVLAEPAGGM